jgi:hypothetical protein
MPNGTMEAINLTGASSIEHQLGPNGQAGDLGSDGLDQFKYKLVQFGFGGNSSLGPLFLTASLAASTGETEEIMNNSPGILDFPANSILGLSFNLQTNSGILHKTAQCRWRLSYPVGPPPAPSPTSKHRPSPDFYSTVS